LSCDLKQVARDIRCNIVECIGSIGVGHIGGCLSIADLLAVLYFQEMNVDPQNPKMPGRDRLICSKGHAGPALYSALALRGFFDKELLLTLNKNGTMLPSHCDMNKTPGIDMTAGSLGQGFSCACGAALGSKMAKDGAIIYTIIGDGESQEGQIWEAAMFAPAKKLDNIIAFTDYNKMQIDGTVDQICDIAPLGDKWRAFGWNVIELEDGHDVYAISDAIKAAKANIGSGKPTMIILNTVKGKGISFIEALGVGSHSTNLSAEDVQRALAEIRGE